MHSGYRKFFVFLFLLLITEPSAFCAQPETEKKNAEVASVSEENNGSDTVLLKNVGLDDILVLALERNRTLIGSKQQINSADARVLQARSALGTKISGNFRQVRVDDVAKSVVGGKTVDLGKRDSQQAYFELSQPLFLSGKDRWALKSARLGRTIAGAGYTLTGQTVILETTMRWLAWLFAEEAEKVSEKDLELAQAHFDLVTTRYKHQQVSQFEVLRAEVRLAQARSDLRKNQNSSELALLNLVKILDLPVDTPISTSEKLEMQDVEIDLVRDTQEARQLREDLRMKKLEVDIARQSIASARSENQPVISVFAQSGVQDPSSKSSMGNYERKSYWQAGVVANFTLADGGMRKGKIKEAHSRLALAENSLQEAFENADIEIRQAFLTIETAREVVAAQKQALKQAEEALRLAGVRYNNGLFTQVELFDAENAYLATRLQYLQAIFSYRQAFVSYQLATGSLGRDLLIKASVP